MPITPKSAKKKGNDLEEFVADGLVSKGLDSRAVRQIGSGSGKRKGDINNDLGWLLECKNVVDFKWAETLRQVRREAMGYLKEAIIRHVPRTPMKDSLVILALEDFLDLLVCQKDLQGRLTILDRNDIKFHMERGIHHLKQIFKDL